MNLVGILKALLISLTQKEKKYIYANHENAYEILNHLTIEKCVNQIVWHLSLTYLP